MKPVGGVSVARQRQAGREALYLLAPTRSHGPASLTAKSSRSGVAVELVSPVTLKACGIAARSTESLSPDAALGRPKTSCVFSHSWRVMTAFVIWM